MPSCDVWQDIDRLAFHENAILLDVRLRSQDAPIRSRIFDEARLPTDDDLSPILIRNVLDDFALVLSGHGGKDNVSAVCMEYDGDPCMVTLRVASNDGISDGKLADLDRLLQLITTVTIKDTGPEYEDVVADVLRQCSGRFYKHAIKFFNELKQARCPPDTHLSFPRFSSRDPVTESSEDASRLGSYDCTTHQAYMQLCRRRLCDLRRACATLAGSRGSPNTPEMVVLAKAAYDIRRSSSFSRFLRHNLLATKKPLAIQSMAQDLTERLGKLSRFWRAAVNLIAFGSVVSAKNISVQVLGIPAPRLMVHELQKRTPADLYSRGGRHFKSCTVVHLQQKLQHWSRYRLHCEMQLVVFYQENSHLQLRSGYIGCDKLACYLCYSFITVHGQFQMKGCHQGLYSLWTVPQNIDFKSTTLALAFQNALRTLAHTLENRMNSLREAKTLQQKFRSYHESTANLSRISVQLSDRLIVAENNTETSGSEHMEHQLSSHSGRRGGSQLFKISETACCDDEDFRRGEADGSPENQSNKTDAETILDHGNLDGQMVTDMEPSHSLVPEISTAKADGSHAHRSATKRGKRSGDVLQAHGHVRQKRRKKRRQHRRDTDHGRRPKDSERRTWRHRVRYEAKGKNSERRMTSTVGPQHDSGVPAGSGGPILGFWSRMAALLTSCFTGHLSEDGS